MARFEYTAKGENVADIIRRDEKSFLNTVDNCGDRCWRGDRRTPIGLSGEMETEDDAWGIYGLMKETAEVVGESFRLTAIGSDLYANYAFRIDFVGTRGHLEIHDFEEYKEELPDAYFDE